MNDQNNDGNPFDQYYEDDDNTQAQEPPRQAPAHLNTQPQQSSSQPTQPPSQTTPTTQDKSPSPAYRPGEEAPARPVHENIHTQSTDSVPDPQAEINKAIIEQSDEVGEPLETFPATDQSQAIPTTPEQPVNTPTQETPTMTTPDIGATQPVMEEQPVQSTPIQTAPTEPDPIFKEPKQTQPKVKVDDSGLPPSRRQITIRRIIMGIILFLVMAAVGVLGSMAASGALGETSEIFQTIRRSIPFISQSKAEVFASILSEDKAVTSYDYDVSASFDIESQNFGDTNSGKIDFAMNGSMFLNDQGTPTEYSTNVEINTSISPASGNIRVNSISTQDKLYLKLDTLSGIFSTYGQLLPPTGQWFMIDLEPLNTQAREALEEYGQNVDQNTGAVEYTQEELAQLLQRLSEIEGVSDSVELKDDVILADGSEAHHLTFTPTTEILIQVASTLFEENGEVMTPDEEQALRDVLENFESLQFDIWASTDDYFVRKLQVTFTYLIDTTQFNSVVWQESTPLVAGASRVLAEQDVQDTINGAIVIEYTNLNDATPLQIPTDPQPIDDYYQQIGSLYSQGFANPTQQLEVERNATTKARTIQIASALEAHATENGGTYPATLDTLVDKLYLREVISPATGRSVYCDDTYNYLVTDDSTQAAVWIDLEPCSPDPTLGTGINYVYWTACGEAVEIEERLPTKDNLAQGIGC